MKLIQAKVQMIISFEKILATRVRILEENKGKSFNVTMEALHSAAEGLSTSAYNALVYGIIAE